MIEKVRAYMEQWNMVQKGDLLTLAVSGGADSVCLFHVMRLLAERMGFSIQVVHVEHGIRGDESIEDAGFVEKLCNDFLIPFHQYSVQVLDYAREHHMGVEEAARLLRYAIFAQVAKGPVALAHHREDNAETVLFQMVRGTGLDGLCGMKPVRTDEEGTCFIRPLLDCGREEIEAFLEMLGQSYCTDSTNLEMDYSRNRIRHMVMPQLSLVNKQAALHLHRNAKKMLALQAYVNEQAKKEYERLVEKTREGEQKLSIAPLKELPEAIRGEVIRLALKELAHSVKNITEVHVDAILHLMQVQTGKSVDLPYGIKVKRQYDSLLFYYEKEGTNFKEPLVLEAWILEQLSEESSVELLLDGEDEKLVLKRKNFDGNLAEISSKMYTKWFDYDKIKSGFCLRTRMPQDYLVVNANGNRKKLSDYMIDEKIPAQIRDEYWLLCKDSQVLWIIGGRMGYGAWVSEDTKQVLEVTYIRRTKEKEYGLQQET